MYFFFSGYKMALITPFACLEGKFDDIMSLGKFLFK